VLSSEGNRERKKSTQNEKIQEKNTVMTNFCECRLHVVSYLTNEHFCECCLHVVSYLTNEKSGKT